MVELVHDLGLNCVSADRRQWCAIGVLLGILFVVILLFFILWLMAPTVRHRIPMLCLLDSTEHPWTLQDSAEHHFTTELPWTLLYSLWPPLNFSCLCWTLLDPADSLWPLLNCPWPCWFPLDPSELSWSVLCWTAVVHIKPDPGTAGLKKFSIINWSILGSHSETPSDVQKKKTSSLLERHLRTGNSPESAENSQTINQFHSIFTPVSLQFGLYLVLPPPGWTGLNRHFGSLSVWLLNLLKCQSRWKQVCVLMFIFCFVFEFHVCVCFI